MNVNTIRKAFAWAMIFGFGCFTACNQRQETSRPVVRQTDVIESCDFAQFKPLKGDFDSHPNSNDRIVTPSYSNEARQAGIEGIVNLKVLVNSAGQVERVCVQSGDSKLVRTSVEAAQKSHFAPLLLNDKPVPYVERTIGFDYVLSRRQPNIVR